MAQITPDGRIISRRFKTYNYVSLECTENSFNNKPFNYKLGLTSRLIFLIHKKNGTSIHIAVPSQHKHKIKHDKTTMQSYLSMPGRHN